jgi:hypothetical protein
MIPNGDFIWKSLSYKVCMLIRLRFRLIKVAMMHEEVPIGGNITNNG